MKVAVLSCMFASASAFMGVPVAVPKTVAAPMKMVAFGADVETGGKPFDPLGLMDIAGEDYMMRAELANGRAAMLATVGWVWPEIFGRFNADVVTSSHGVDAFTQTPPEVWVQIVALCGIIEGQMWQHRNSGSTKPFFDPAKLFPKDAAGQRDIKMKELKNGRLAMIAWASFVAHALIPGSVPGFPLPF